MTYDWSTYRPRRKRNGFETARMYFNAGLLFFFLACVLASILLVGCVTEMRPLFNRVW